MLYDTCIGIVIVDSGGKWYGKHANLPCLIPKPGYCAYLIVYAQVHVPTYRASILDRLYYTITYACVCVRVYAIIYWCVPWCTHTYRVDQLIDRAEVSIISKIKISLRVRM